MNFITLPHSPLLPFLTVSTHTSTLSFHRRRHPTTISRVSFHLPTTTMEDHETKPPIIHLNRPIPTPNSTIPELISYLRSSHQKDSFDMVTEFLLAREENLKISVKELVNRNKDLELIENKHRQLVLEKASIEDELKSFRFEYGEMREKLTRSVDELNLYVGREKSYGKLVEDYKEAESKLRGEKLRSEAETVTWKKKYRDLAQKVLKLEEYIGGLLENEGEELRGAESSDKNHDNGRTILGNGKSEIIEIGDSDDDKPNGNGFALTTTIASEPGAKETMTPHSTPHTKRASSSELPVTNTVQHKIRRLQEMGHEPEVALMDSFMEELVGNLQGERECQAWKNETDMIQAFEKDYEICMNAICAIHRQQKSQKKSSNQGFRHFHVLSGTKLAELLIDGDPEGRLRKSVSDLQQHNKNALEECRKLAKLYSKQLFQIYKSKEDPLFFPY